MERVKNVPFLARVTSKSRVWVSFFLVMPPGPDLVYKESVYGVQPRNNVSLISYSNNVAPGQAWPRPACHPPAGCRAGMAGRPGLYGMSICASSGE